VEQRLLPADAAVVALVGLLDAGDVGIELLLVGPGGAVDALQLLVLGVAAPVGAGDAGQLERLQEARVGHVRAAAHVHVFLVVVQAHGGFVGHVLDQPQLVVLATDPEHLDHLRPRRDLLDHLVVLLDQLAHARLDRRQVFGREGAFVPDVVVEAFGDHRADDHLGLRIQLLDRVADQVGAGVADDFHALLVLGRDDAQAGVMVDAVAGVDQPAVHGAGHGGLGQARADGLGDVHDADGMFELAAAAVGKRDRDHFRNHEKQKKAPRAFDQTEAGGGESALGDASAHVARSAGRPGHLGVDARGFALGAMVMQKPARAMRPAPGPGRAGTVLLAIARGCPGLQSPGNGRHFFPAPPCATHQDTPMMEHICRNRPIPRLGAVFDGESRASRRPRWTSSGATAVAAGRLALACVLLAALSACGTRQPLRRHRR
jgi:hypothetical protein